MSPMQRDLYPKNWDSIAHAVKTAANWTCQSCGKVCRQQGEIWTDYLIRVNPSVGEAIGMAAHPIRYDLNAAHLDHNPPNCNPENLMALCNPCHCRMDLKAIPLKQHMKRERHGQMTLFKEVE